MKKLSTTQKGIYIIGIEDITANAFIELGKRNENISNIPIWILEEYGQKVVNKLNQEGNDVLLWLSQIQTNEFLYHYREYFMLNSDGPTDDTIELKENIKLEKLVETFRTNLSNSASLAYQNDEVVEEGLLKYLNKDKNKKEILSKKMLTKK